MIKPVISVIMPTYKHKHFIRRAIASLQAQTFNDWELIIVNDASPDATEDIIPAHLDDKRIQYYSNNENQGLGACLNFGIEKAQGSYIAYLPSDDVIYKDHLTIFIRYFSKKSRCCPGLLIYPPFLQPQVRRNYKQHMVTTGAGDAQKNRRPLDREK